eukprot:TRINITY_DN12712_c0_g1_i1.p1 TRINITY_DN12712_c0_g1~~TRINITY_DN12712_c0_g1_i1.p1  ORF type:complete len:270 (-),score=52.92 TRINITY_DN12712_c0_g1_i1:40-849(-)
MSRYNERTPLTQGGNALTLIMEQTKQLSNEVGHLERLISQIGTQRDSQSLRDQLKEKRDLCARLSKSTAQIYESRSREIPASDKYQAEKLMSQLQGFVKRFQNLTQDCLQKERNTPIPTEHEPVFRRGAPVTVSDSRQSQRLSERDSSVGLSTSFQSVQSFDSNVDSAIIEERNEDIRKLEKDMQQLNEVFIDVARIIDEQGHMITTIEDNTFHAANNTEEGTNQLRQASTYQRSSRSKLCCLLLILVLVLAALGLFAGLWLGVFKKKN